MTVKEAIEILQKCPPESKIEIYDVNFNEWITEWFISTPTKEDKKLPNPPTNNAVVISFT